LIWLPSALGHNLDVGWEISRWLHIAGGPGPFLGAVISTNIFNKNSQSWNKGQLTVQLKIELFDQIWVKNHFWPDRRDKEFCEQEWSGHE
jgi:hypothetical protein